MLMGMLYMNAEIFDIGYTLKEPKNVIRLEAFNKEKQKFE